MSQFVLHALAFVMAVLTWYPVGRMLRSSHDRT